MILTLFKMTRPVNIAIAVITLAIGYYLLGEISFSNNANTDSNISLIRFCMQALGFACAIGFANIHNDILDLESDKKNRPKRPLPSGRISQNKAKFFWIFLLCIGILCGIIDSACSSSGLWFDGLDSLTSAIFFSFLSLLLIAYNKKLKHVPLLKNMTVAFLCTTPLVLCLFCPTGFRETDLDGLDFATKLGLLYPAMIFAFLLTTAREIYKDLEDEAGDLMAGILTFPIAVGAKTARRLASALIGFTWILLPLPVVQGYYPLRFFIMTFVTLTPIFIYIFFQAKKQKYHKAQSITKIAMFLGLVALII